METGDGKGSGTGGQMPYLCMARESVERQLRNVLRLHLPLEGYS